MSRGRLIGSWVSGGWWLGGEELAAGWVGGWMGERVGGWVVGWVHKNTEYDGIGVKGLRGMKYQGSRVPEFRTSIRARFKAL